MICEAIQWKPLQITFICKYSYFTRSVKKKKKVVLVHNCWYSWPPDALTVINRKRSCRLFCLSHPSCWNITKEQDKNWKLKTSTQEHLLAINFLFRASSSNVTLWTATNNRPITDGIHYVFPCDKMTVFSLITDWRADKNASHDPICMPFQWGRRRTVETRKILTKYLKKNLWWMHMKTNANTITLSNGRDTLSSLGVKCVFFGDVFTVSWSQPQSTSAPHLCHNKLVTCTSSAPAAVASARSPLVEHSALAWNADALTVVTARNINVMTDHSCSCDKI